MAYYGVEPGFTFGNCIAEVKGKSSPVGVVDAAAANHGLKDWPEHGLLKLVLGDKVKVNNDLFKLVVNFIGANAVFSVVSPELVFAHLHMPVFAVVFPVDVVVAVHGGEEVKALG